MVSKKALSKRATIADLLKKPPRFKDVTIAFGEEELTIQFRSIGSKQYDDLIGAHKPTKEQLKENPNSSWNMDTFPPALISACAVDPLISADEAIDIWSSTDWSKGELMDMFLAVLKLNSEGLDVPFTESD